MHALPVEISEHLEAIRALCAKYHVTKLTLFGSAARGTFDRRTSDVDLIVQFEWHPDPLERGRRYNELWRALKRLLARKVDLLEVSTIKNPYLADSIRSAQLDLYDAA